MIKALIIAHDYPPNRSVSALRPFSWFKYFNENGIYPCIVTRHWDREIRVQEDAHKPSIDQEIKFENFESGEVVRVPFKGDWRDRIIAAYGMNRFIFLRRLLSLFYLLSKYYLLKSDNLNALFFAAKSKLEVEKFDVIICTGEPFILFKYGSRLSNEFGIPWIADYRDNWAYNPRQHSPVFIRFVHQLIEKKYVSTSLFATVASPTYGEPIKEIVGKKLVVVYNGYDHSPAKKLISRENNGRFILAYTGIIYDHQPVEEFIEVLKEISQRDQGIDFELRFLGSNFYQDNVQRIKSCTSEISDKVKFVDRVPYDQLVDSLTEADVLILLSDHGIGWLNTKVFDYMASRRLIVLYKNDGGILEQLLKETGSGISVRSKEELHSVLSGLWEEFKRSGRVQNGDSRVEQYARSSQAAIFCTQIKKYLNSPK